MNRIIFSINMKKIMQIILCILSLVTIEGCIYHAVFTARTCKGKIIDADTKQPIEGVVVLGIWYDEILTPAGSISQYHDAKETVTDKNGDFIIKGTTFMIFKAGYRYLRMGPNIFKKRIEDIGLRDKIKWKKGKAIIPLRKLTMEERKRQGTPPFPTEAYPKLKIPLLIKEINKEKIELGLPPYREEDWS